MEEEPHDAEYEHYDALLYIAGISKDRHSTDDPRLLKIFLQEIERVAEKALHLRTKIPATFYEAFTEGENNV